MTEKGFEVQVIGPDEEEIERTRNTRILQAVIGLVGILILVSFNFWYTAYSQDQNNHKWCSLMVSLDDRYQALPRDANPDAKAFAAQVHALRQDLDCRRTTPPSVRPSPSERESP